MYFVGNLEIRVKTSEHIVDYGTTVKLECELVGSSTPKLVFWQKDAKDKKTKELCIDNQKYTGSTISDPSLIIANVNQDDIGSYFCSAVLHSDSQIIQGKKLLVSVRGKQST